MTGPDFSKKDEALLTQICHSYIHAMNIRDFNPQSPIWSETTTPECRLTASAGAMFSSNSETSENSEYNLTISDMCTMWSKSAEAHPNWKSRVVDIVITPHPSSGTAEAWCNAEHSNLPEGVTRSALWIGYFRLVEGEWRLYKARTVSGMGSQDGF